MSSTADNVRESPSNFWGDIREALAGSHQDFTEGALGRAILLLSVPMVLEMMMESLFGIVDGFFVAHLGRDAMATVGLTESMLTLIFAAAMGLSAGTTATVARRIGEKHPDAAGVAAFQAIVLGLAISVTVGILGVILAPKLLSLMGASPAILKTGTNFTRIMLGGSVSIFLLFLINAVFRGAGDPAMAMRTLWLANIINILLNPCLIFGLGPFPTLGVEGSAVGTTIGRSVGVLFAIWILVKGDGRIRIRRDQMRLDFPVMFRIVRLSLGATFQVFITMASWIGLMRITSTFGSAAIAGYTIAIRIVIFALLPSWGVCNAAATLVGQNLGAGKPQRAEQAVWRAGFYNAMFLGVVEIIFITLARPIILIFTQDPAVVEVAVSCLRIISMAYVFFAFGMVMEQSFNGAGDTVTPIYINLFCYWIVQLPLAYFLALQAGFGPKGIFMSVAICESLLAVVASLAFRRGTWKLKKV